MSARDQGAIEGPAAVLRRRAAMRAKGRRFDVLRCTVRSEIPPYDDQLPHVAPALLALRLGSWGCMTRSARGVEDSANPPASPRKGLQLPDFGRCQLQAVTAECGDNSGNQCSPCNRGAPSPGRPASCASSCPAAQASLTLRAQARSGVAAAPVAGAACQRTHRCRTGFGRKRAA